MSGNPIDQAGPTRSTNIPQNANQLVPRVSNENRAGERELTGISETGAHPALLLYTIHLPLSCTNTNNNQIIIRIDSILTTKTERGLPLSQRISRFVPLISLLIILGLTQGSDHTLYLSLVIISETTLWNIGESERK